MNQLLDLYRRCLRAVEGAVSRERGSTIASQGILRVVVAGAGAFGRNHLRVLRELETAGQGVMLAAAVEPDAARAAEAAAQYGIPVFASVDELLAADLKLDAACVAVPTVQHHAVASALLEAGARSAGGETPGCDSCRSRRPDRRAERNGRILQPGHLERFNPAVLAVEPRVKRPMFFEAHRLSVFTPRSLDVDVILDLMIHDLDIVLTLAASRGARSAGGGLAHRLAARGYCQRAGGVRIGLRGEFHGFARFHGAGAQAALL